MKNFWEGKRVLVTGASGFIGSHVVDALVKMSAFVTAGISYTKPLKKAKRSFSSPLNRILLKRVNLLSINDCLKITKNIDIVLNFAALDGGHSFKEKHSADIMRVNSQIALNMLEASRQNSVERFLLMSSVEVYSSLSPLPLYDSYFSDKSTEKFTNGYIWSKQFSEILAKTYASDYKLKIAIARCGNVYGPRDDINKKRIISTFISNALEGKDILILGNPSSKRSFLYIADLLPALFNLVEKYSNCDPVNIASEQVISYKQLAKLVNNLVGSKSKVIEKNKPSKKSIHRIIDVGKAKKILNFTENVSLVEGVTQTIDYFKNTKR